jgi:ubiquinone/menaquinone biosynthesis C-methylase UbiE
VGSQGSDRLFAGSIPQFYERYMVPLMFEPYAADLASRVARLRPSRVLEIAAGTGVVTRHLAAMLPSGVAIVATDLNQQMLDQAAVIAPTLNVEWRQADAMLLPFPDGSFDVVVCQFGVMFFPDKPRAMSEAKRVLRPGGAFIFSVWDRIEHNEFADTVDRALHGLFANDPPRFLARVPHGYYDSAVITQDLVRGGFERAPVITTLAERSRADSSRFVAVALCQGTPLRSEIETRGPGMLDDATDIADAAIAGRFGHGAVDGRMQAHFVTTGW